MTRERWTEARHGPDSITKGCAPSWTTAELLQSVPVNTKWPDEPDASHAHSKIAEITHRELDFNIKLVGVISGMKLHESERS